jgi:hypothetical protein
MKIPILTYHAMSVHGNSPENNDLVALARDLERICDEGLEILPLHEVVRSWIADFEGLRGRKVVALSCDDGSDFDFLDLPHPTWGTQRSVLNILRDLRRDRPSTQPGLHVTSFVIVSPEARTRLDETCMIGKGWWTDDWWRPAIESGLMGIANHSWDHNHESLGEHGLPGVARGTFKSIDSREGADFEIAQAERFLRRKAPNNSSGLFAYPYGERNDFLEDYFEARARWRALRPASWRGPRFVAAFTTDAACLSRGDLRWRLPRFVCGRDWKSPDELRRILDEASP